LLKMTGHLTEGHKKAQKQRKPVSCKGAKADAKPQRIFCAVACILAPLRETLTFCGYTSRHAEEKSSR
jgi:hypothetical protein